MLTLYEGRVVQVENCDLDQSVNGCAAKVLAIGPTFVLGKDQVAVEVLQVDHQWRTVVKANDLSALTENQEKLRNAHGLPHEFAAACWRACDNLEITPSESRAAIQKYVEEFYK